jgi:hypothetical protein
MTMTAVLQVIMLSISCGGAHAWALSNDSTRCNIKTEDQVMVGEKTTIKQDVEGPSVKNDGGTMVTGSAQPSTALVVAGKTPNAQVFDQFGSDTAAHMIANFSGLVHAWPLTEVTEAFLYNLNRVYITLKSLVQAVEGAAITLLQGGEVTPHMTMSLQVYNPHWHETVVEGTRTHERYVCYYWRKDRRRFGSSGKRRGRAVLADACLYVLKCFVKGVAGMLAVFSRALRVIPPRVLLACALLALLKKAEAVTCMSCHDGVPGCAGGSACPFFATPIINNDILSSAGGTHTSATGTVTTLIVCATILPRAISRFLTRGVLDFFKSVARRAAPGVPVAVADLNSAEIVEAVRGGRVEIADAVSEILSRLPTATAAEGTRLTTIVSALGQLDKLGSHTSGAGTAANGELWGAFTYAWTQAGRVVLFSSESMVQAGQSADDGETSAAATTERKAMKAAKILRPRSVHEFYHMLSVWQMICQAVALANSLATGAFLEQVVHEQVAKNDLTWQEAHELFLVYLEAVETAPAGSNLTLANVYASGGHDMYRERAKMRAKDMFKGQPTRDPQDIFRGDKCVYIGQTSSGSPCTTFNLGKPNDQHPRQALDATGRCKYAHRCDQWVTEQPDGTKGGICGSWKHCRKHCDNPKKSATKVSP